MPLNKRAFFALMVVFMNSIIYGTIVFGASGEEPQAQQVKIDEQPATVAQRKPWLYPPSPALPIPPPAMKAAGAPSENRLFERQIEERPRTDKKKNSASGHPDRAEGERRA